MSLDVVDTSQANRLQFSSISRRLFEKLYYGDEPPISYTPDEFRDLLEAL
jgi:hypothetical protein